MKKNQEKTPIHTRWNYVDHSVRFVDWVNRLGVEQTFFGRIAYVLDTHFMIRKVVLLFFFVFGLSFLVTYSFEFNLANYSKGEVASSNIKSPITTDLVDEYQTHIKQENAVTAVPEVFDYNPNAYEQLVNRVYIGFREARKLVDSETWPRNQAAREIKVKEFLRYQPKFEEQLGQISVPSRAFEWMVENRFPVHTENLVIRALENLSTNKIADGLSGLALSPETKIAMRVTDKTGGIEEHATQIASIRDRTEVVADTSVDRLPGVEHLDSADRLQLQHLIQALIVPNLILNIQETSVRREQARALITPVQVSLKKGQTIVAAGTVLDESQIKILKRIHEIQSDKNKDFLAFIVALMLVVLVLVFGSYLRRFTLNRVHISTKDLVAMGAVTVMIVIIDRLMIFLLGGALADRIGISIPSSSISYALPTAAGSMLVGLLITSGEVVWIYSVFMAAVTSMIVGASDAYLLVTIVAGIAGARGVHKCKKRKDVYMAGVRVGLINAVMIFLATLTVGNYVTDITTTLKWNVGAGFVAGILSSLIALMLVPLLETLFNYTTDVRLLELGNLDHPLLKEMIVKAPGTYHHSLIVGSMVEAAAEEIGANPLLAKVASYYHDIGKTAHAQYFIENQRPGHNLHDHLSPHLSKTVLIAHAKDGVELAMEYKLGKPIIDVILQHHGTTLISFFFNKAKETQDVHAREVSEEDFRYPGPRPQFREAALCMIADSIEAAARSLDEPTPIRLQNIVKNIIHRKFMDGQLEECNLTLRDLSMIEHTFIRVLLGIHHQRIDYPRAAGGGASERPPMNLLK